MSAPDDRGLARHLAAWRADSRSAPRPEAIAEARRAMLAAPPPASAAGWRSLLGLRPRRRGRLVVATLAAGLAVLTPITVLGWDAPAGTPLHGVSVVKEHVALAVPGVDHVALTLQFAEQSLADARAGHDPRDSLAEAKSLLDGVAGELPADGGAAVRARWSRDEAELAAIEDDLAGSETAAPAEGSGGRESTPAASGRPATAEPSDEAGPSRPPSSPGASTEPTPAGESAAALPTPAPSGSDR